MDETELMEQEQAAALSDDEELEALIALIEERVVENFARAIEQMMLERDFSP